MQRNQRLHRFVDFKKWVSCRILLALVVYRDHFNSWFLGAAVREKASLAMTSLTLSDAGKQFAIKANAVEGLCPLLEDPNWKVRANAAGSIMSIAIDDMGKVLIDSVEVFCTK